MKRYFVVGILIGSIFISGSLVSCNKKEKNDLAAIEKKLRDSLDQKYKPEEKLYVYFDSIPVYRTRALTEIIDYIPFCEKVYVDTIFQPRVDTDEEYCVGIAYVEGGELLLAITKQDYFARQVAISNNDSTLMFMSNFLETKGDFCPVEIKAVKDQKMVTSFVPDDSVNLGYDLYTFVIDNIQLQDAGEIIYLNTNYPACGHASNSWYLAYKNNQFGILTHSVDWADAPYAAYTNVYLPFKTDKGVVMAQWSQYYTDSDYLITDTAGKVETVQLPDEFLKDLDQMIYLESHRTYEVVDEDGNPVLDENEESKLGNELYDRRWLKWDGLKMVEVKVDTNVVRIPY